MAKKPTPNDQPPAAADASDEQNAAASAAPAAEQNSEAATAEPAPAAAVTAATPEPEAPASAAPASPEADSEEEAEPQTFMQHLQSEISAAEQAAKTDLHSWLVSLESHLGGLVAHCKRLEQEASPEIQKFVAGVKSLL